MCVLRWRCSIETNFPTQPSQPAQPANQPTQPPQPRNPACRLFNPCLCPPQRRIGVTAKGPVRSVGMLPAPTMRMLSASGNALSTQTPCNGFAPCVVVFCVVCQKNVPSIPDTCPKHWLTNDSGDVAEPCAQTYIVQKHQGRDRAAPRLDCPCCRLDLAVTSETPPRSPGPGPEP